MIKLRFLNSKYQVVSNPNSPSIKTIYKIEACLVDTINKEEICKVFSTGESFCNPTDQYNKDFGIQLAQSRAIIGAYKSAIDYAEPYAKDSLEFITFVCTTKFALNREQVHKGNLLGYSVEPLTGLKDMIMKKVEKNLPNLTVKFDKFEE